MDHKKEETKKKNSKISLSKDRIVKWLFDNYHYLTALIAVLTSALVTLSFNGFNYYIGFSVLFGVIDIILMVILQNICSIYKQFEFDLRWQNKQEQDENLYADALLSAMMDMGKWDKGDTTENQLNSMKTKIVVKAGMTVLSFIVAVVFSCLGVNKLRTDTEKLRFDTYNQASVDNLKLLENRIDVFSDEANVKYDSLMNSITHLESEMSTEMNHVMTWIQRIEK